MRTLTTGAVALLALLGATGCEDVNKALQRMEKQPKVLPYNANPYFADNRGMRTPPAGTIARERLADLGPNARGRLADGSYVTQSPLPVTAQTLARGKERFDIICAACHGLTGDGNSLVAQNMALRTPPNLHTRRNMPDGFFFDIITHGFGLMPPYGQHLSVEDRWAIVAYLRALQLSQNAPVALVPAADKNSLEGRQ